MTAPNWDESHQKKPISETNNDTLLCLQMGTQHNSSEKVHPETNGRRQKGLQANIRQSLASLSQGLGGVGDPKMTGTPWENQQYHLTSTPESSKQKVSMGWTQDRCTQVAVEQFGLHIGSLTSGAGAMPEPIACLLVYPVFLNGPPSLVSVDWGKDLSKEVL